MPRRIHRFSTTHFAGETVAADLEAQKHAHRAFRLRERSCRPLRPPAVEPWACIASYRNDVELLRRAGLVAAVVAVTACGSSPSVLAPQSTASVASSSAVPSTSPANPAVTPSTTALPVQQGLTVTASPRTGLVEGRAVTAHGEGWPTGMEVGVEQCAANRFPADRSECEITRSVDATTYRHDGDDQRRRTRKAYVIDGPRLVTVRDDNGVIARSAPAPPGVPLDNTLAC